MANAIVEKAKERMTQSHQSLAREFGSIRAGRANASLLDRISVEYYGVETPLNQIASITIPEARVLLVTPFDKSSIKDIERALNASDLGITPASDGTVIRLVIPALTEETRRDLAKEVKKVGEKPRMTPALVATALPPLNSAKMGKVCPRTAKSPKTRGEIPLI